MLSNLSQFHQQSSDRLTAIALRRQKAMAASTFLSAVAYGGSIPLLEAPQGTLSAQSLGLHYRSGSLVLARRNSHGVIF
jgi:hypothetical protein